MPKVGGGLGSGKAGLDSLPPGPAHLLGGETRGVTLCPRPLLEGGQADSLQALQALVHLQGHSQGLGTSIANAVTGESVRDEPRVSWFSGGAWRGGAGAWGQGSAPGPCFLCWVKGAQCTARAARVRGR